MINPDEGSIFLENQPVEITTPARYPPGLEFIRPGAQPGAKVHCHAKYDPRAAQSSPHGVDQLASSPAGGGIAAERVGINFPLDMPVNELSVAEQWLVSIARALVHRARLIAMDEPTASLSEEETRRLFQIIRELSADGIGILYVSHRLDEILDKLRSGITVFKDGVTVLRTNVKETNKQALVYAIVGSNLPTSVSAEAAAVSSSPVILETRSLSRGRYVRDVSFALHRGEVLGLGGTARLRSF